MGDGEPTEDLGWEFAVNSDAGLMPCSDRRHAEALTRVTKGSWTIMRRRRSQWEPVQ